MPELPKVGVTATLAEIDKFKRDVKAYNDALAGMKSQTTGAADAQGKLSDGLGKVSPKLQQLQNKAKALAGDARALGGRVDAMSQSMLGGAAGAGTFADSLGGLAVGIGGVVAVIGGAITLFHAATEALERVEPLWQARDAYAALGAQVGLTSRTLISDTVRASQFTVSEYKVITAANRDLLAGYGELADAYPELMKLASTTAAALGRSTEQQFDAITRAIRSGKQSALEAAGVWIEIEEAQEAWGERSGRTVEQLSDEERMLIAVRTVLEEIPSYIEGMGGASESALAPIRELKTEIGLLKDEMLAAIATGFLGFLQALGIDLAGGVRGLRGRIAAGQQIAPLWEEARAKYEAGEIPRDVFDALAKSVLAARRGVRPELALAQLQKILGRVPAGVVPGLPGAPSVDPLVEAEADTISEARDEFKDKLIEKAETQALALAGLLTFQETQDALARMNRDIELYMENFTDLSSLEARFALSEMTGIWKEFGSEVRKANRGLGTSTSALREYNKMLVYTADGGRGIGGWARAFAREHGGRSPLEQYKRHADPLQAAMIDRMWGEQFGREKGRPPTQAEWEAHWYEQWAPLELYPGGPIAKATGGLADIVDELLDKENLGGLGDPFHQMFLESKDLAPKFKLVKDEAEILAEFTKDTYVPTIQTTTTEIENLGNAAAAAAGKISPPTEEEEEKPPGEQERVYFPSPLGQTNAPKPFTIPHHWLQQGGLTRGAGIYGLHAGELVMPLNRLIDMVSMRLPGAGGGGGGLSIGQLSIPVNVAGGAGPGVAGEIQGAVVNAIRGRAGTELIRAARRLGR